MLLTIKKELKEIKDGRPNIENALDTPAFTVNGNLKAIAQDICEISTNAVKGFSVDSGEDSTSLERLHIACSHVLLHLIEAELLKRFTKEKTEYVLRQLMRILVTEACTKLFPKGESTSVLSEYFITFYESNYKIYVNYLSTVENKLKKAASHDPIQHSDSLKNSILQWITESTNSSQKAERVCQLLCEAWSGKKIQQKISTL